MDLCYIAVAPKRSRGKFQFYSAHHLIPPPAGLHSTCVEIKQHLRGASATRASEFGTYGKMKERRLFLLFLVLHCFVLVLSGLLTGSPSFYSCLTREESVL
jgi:hypothetical protein